MSRRINDYHEQYVCTVHPRDSPTTASPTLPGHYGRYTHTLTIQASRSDAISNVDHAPAWSFCITGTFEEKKGKKILSLSPHTNPLTHSLSD